MSPVRWNRRRSSSEESERNNCYNIKTSSVTSVSRATSNGSNGGGINGNNNNTTTTHALTSSSSLSSSLSAAGKKDKRRIKDERRRASCDRRQPLLDRVRTSLLKNHDDDDKENDEEDDDEEDDDENGDQPPFRSMCELRGSNASQAKLLARSETSRRSVCETDFKQQQQQQRAVELEAQERKRRSKSQSRLSQSEDKFGFKLNESPKPRRRRWRKSRDTLFSSKSSSTTTMKTGDEQQQDSVSKSEKNLKSEGSSNGGSASSNWFPAKFRVMQNRMDPRSRNKKNRDRRDDDINKEKIVLELPTMTVGKFANFRSEFDKYNPYLWGKISHNISYTRRRRTLVKSNTPIFRNPRRQAEEIADGPDRTATANLDETAAAAGLNKTGAADTTSSGTDDGTCYLDNDDDEQVAAASSPTVDKKRNDVIQELIKTERNYSEVLNSLLQDFAWPLSDYFRPQHSACIFLGIQELAEMHAGFRSQLRKAKGGAALGQVFLDWREKFLIYGDYCANLTTAQSTLNDVCSHNEALNQEVIRCQQRSSNDEFKLRDLLTVPIQRVLNYHVLLDKLVEETPCEWVEDRKRLVKARNAIQNLRNHMDSCSTDRKRLNKIERLQGLITNRTEDIPLMHHGRILKQGRLKIRTQSDQRFKNRYVILFEKAMLVCKVGRGNHYRYHQTIKLDEYYIKNTPFPGYWLFIHNYGSPKIYICVHHTREYGPALCDELKNQWLKKIKLCLYHLEPFDYLNCDHKFRYYQFEGAHLCATCQLHLIGYLRQGYKCLECGECAHRECIPHSKICMPELTPPPQPTPLPNPFERELTAQLWYVGVSSWKLAEEKLEAREDGTYMVRARPPRTQPRSALETSYALCVKADGTVKHIRIFKRAVDGADLYFLSKTRFFKSVVELVQYYERVSLTENFEKLDQRLQWPYRRIVAEALLHYQMGEPGELVLYKGCKVILLSKGCDGEGTWRGTCANQVGSFPKEYVIVIEESI